MPQLQDVLIHPRRIRLRRNTLLDGVAFWLVVGVSFAAITAIGGGLGWSFGALADLLAWWLS